MLNDAQIKQIEELGNKPINAPIFDKKNIFNKTDTNLLSLNNNLVYDKFMGNDIKLFNDFTKDKIDILCLTIGWSKIISFIFLLD